MATTAALRRHDPATVVRAALVALLVGALAAAALPGPAGATSITPSSVEATLLSMTNKDRAARGLRALRLDPKLAAVADDRALALVGAATFSHAAAGGSLTPALSEAGVQWYAWAENIAWMPGGLTSYTAPMIYAGWKGSSGHWAALMSTTLNYVGFGVALRAEDGRVFASAVFTESRDHTPPIPVMDAASRSGTTVTFRWHGSEPRLQTHTAGLRDFDVWYRVDEGTWRLIRDNTTATGITLTSRPHGHRYWLRITARDRAGNASRPSTALSAWVP
jgi:uncharacterized protein YkwD